ncbi:MAG: transcription elongation factor GreA [bacterium]|nr:transcription elongation factor GreA [bacterium]
MSNAKIYMSKDGYEKLRAELQYCQTIKRRELSKAIGVARDHGDISENAEYDAAKEAQAFNEHRISELQDKFRRAQILDESNISNDEVLIGATVKLKDLDSGEELEYTLVSEFEADFMENKISISSPIGNNLLGLKKNDTVEIKVPAGTIKYKVLCISR